ncbi:MAG: GNAT family N-acetyltransferase [Verrucomicrobiales bacterium]|nr:GNAT family N-acetyltransferase [Verrucomicrobiales bacterium]
MFTLRTMVASDFDSVAELIFLSTNSWYQHRLGRSVFQCKPQDCRLFCEVYEDLDEGCGIVMEHNKTGMLAASCFYHPRETHVSLGIMNVHPNYFGHGLAGQLLKEIILYAEGKDLPVRLVSSALNLDSFSLYNRFGFSPHGVYQDMILSVPRKGVAVEENRELPKVREATPNDLVAMGTVEFDVSGISRENDYCYFIENSSGIWHTLVSLDEEGDVDGFLVSLRHPASHMIGPGVAKNSKAAEALLLAQLERFCGETVVFLVPSTERELIDAAYSWGARNCEIHFAQVRGEAQPVNGIVMPTFLPESG